MKSAAAPPPEAGQDRFLRPHAAAERLGLHTAARPLGLHAVAQCRPDQATYQATAIVSAGI